MPRSLLLAAVLVASPVAQAQWSEDPMTNLTIADRPAGQAQPKVVALYSEPSFQNVYVSWFGGGADGYDVYLQRLDAFGNAQWADDGIRVADRAYSSTQDYGLAHGANSEAYLAFRVDVGGTDQVGVRRISSDGTSLWGDLVATADPDGANSPQVAAMPDGGAVIGWTSGGGALRLQRLDGSGAPLWGDDGIAITPPTGVFFIGGLISSGDGSVIVSGQAQLSFQSRQLWAQKFDAAGTPLWGDDPVAVWDGTGGALQFGYFPAPIPDHTGGAVFAWYAVSGVAGSQVYVQHVRADGTPAFATNGLEVAMTARPRFAPDALLYDSGEIYVAWPEESPNLPRLFGVSAQRISPSGERLLGDGGLTLAQLGTEQTSQVSLSRAAFGPVVAWATGSGPGPMTLTAAGFFADGTGIRWTVPFKTAATSVSRMDAADSIPTYVWADGGDPSPIKAQHVLADGRLGAPNPLPSTEPDPRALASLRVAPQPVDGEATIHVSMAEAAHVRLDVLDALGRRVATLADGALAAGDHTLAFDARGLAPGVYVARLTSADRHAMLRLVVR